MTTASSDATNDDVWTIARVLRWAGTDLQKHGSPSPRLDAELLLSLVLDCTRIDLITQADRPLIPAELHRYRALHKRRRRGEPVAYLKGEREFYGRRFLVDARVLVPRPETEHLVEVGLRRTRHLSLSARVLDLCTGSGCVGITLKKERPTTDVSATDISPDALDVAKRNALLHSAIISWRRADLFQGVAGGPFDLIVSNPPYISTPDMADLPRDVRDFEPHLALEAGSNGLGLIERIVRDAPAHLRPGGVLALEVGAGEAPAVRGMMGEAGLHELEVEVDYGGHERVVSGARPGP
ncbi:MAG: peptide chain release factor N(5)-glutamine methyltransferase [Myxococcota bacterium]